jgi:hypothetical protein
VQLNTKGLRRKKKISSMVSAKVYIRPKSVSLKLTPFHSKEAEQSSVLPTLLHELKRVF